MGNGGSLDCEFKGKTETMELLRNLVTKDELRKGAYAVIEANADLKQKVIDNVQGEDNYNEIFSLQGEDAWTKLNSSAEDGEKEQLALLLEPYLSKTA